MSAAVVQVEPPTEFDYDPSPRQATAHAMVVGELLYGGAAGGGKSRWARAEAIRMCLLVPGAQVLLLRRTYPELAMAVIDYLRQEMPPGLARFNVSKYVWRFTNGSVLHLGYLENEADVYRYQGAEFTLVIFEELTQFTEKQYKYLLTRLRAAGAVLDRLNQLGWKPRVLATSNPGGVGHSWVKRRFIDPARPGTPFQVKPTPDEPRPLSRCFIPAKLTDNPHIDQQAYTDQLSAQDPMLRRALLDGDWDILEGVRFTQWRAATHVVEPERMLPIDQLWQYPRCVAVDWGIGAPFCALWMVLLPAGVVVVYREVYQAGLTDDQQVAAINALEQPGERAPHRPLPIVIDPSTWARTAKSPQQRELEHGTDLPPAGSVARAYADGFGAGAVVKAQNARVPGWALIDRHLAVTDVGGQQLPKLLVFSTCRELIRTLPALPRAKLNPEDVDTKAEDHAADALRYGLQYLAGGGRKPDTGRLERKPASPVTAGLREAAF